MKNNFGSNTSFSAALLWLFLSLLAFSSATKSSTLIPAKAAQSYALETYVGVINVRTKKSITGTGIYLLHTTAQVAPLTLVFRHGSPDAPMLTGDKVQIVGLNAAGKLFVQRIKSLPSNSLPF